MSSAKDGNGYGGEGGEGTDTRAGSRKEFDRSTWQDKDTERAGFPAGGASADRLGFKSDVPGSSEEAAPFLLLARDPATFRT